jgi:hypothetical protein
MYQTIRRHFPEESIHSNRRDDFNPSTLLYTALPRELAQAVRPLPCIREALGSSIGESTDYALQVNIRIILWHVR